MNRFAELGCGESSSWLYVKRRPRNDERRSVPRSGLVHPMLTDARIISFVINHYCAIVIDVWAKSVNDFALTKFPLFQQLTASRRSACPLRTVASHLLSARAHIRPDLP